MEARTESKIKMELEYQVSVFVRIKAVRKPITVISPTKLCPSSKASGIIVLLNMARMAPAATAIVPAIILGDRPLKIV